MAWIFQGSNASYSISRLRGRQQWRPVQRHRPIFYRVGLLAFIALNRCLHQRGIDSMAAARHIAVLVQLLLDLFEHLGARAGLGQAVTEHPYRLGIGHAAAVGQTQKLQEAAAVQQLVFQRVVGQVVELLKHQNPHHQQGRIRRTAALGTRWPRYRSIDPSRQGGKVHMLGQTHQRATDLAAPVFTLMLCTQTDLGLHHHRYTVVGDARILTSQAADDWVFRGGLKESELG